MIHNVVAHGYSTHPLNNTRPGELVGWTPQNAGRGTLDIIWACFLTVLICTWTAIHPRIHTSSRLSIWHKALQLIKMVLAPEMVCLESLQEYVQARKLISRVACNTGSGLQLIQAYYIGMMGLRYRTAVGWNVLWPSQYAYLLKQKLISWEDRSLWGLDIQTIRDKNKADGLVKLATLWQVVWFTLNCITREAKGVPIAPIEAMTLAYVFVTILTYAFWWRKPKDIATASFVDLPVMTEIQRSAFESLSMETTYDTDEENWKPSKNIAWYLIARDCESHHLVQLLNDASQTCFLDDTLTAHHTETICQSKTSTEIQIRGISRAAPLPRPPPCVAAEVPDPKIITEWDSTLYMSKWWPLINLLGAAFGAIHLISWNSRFPTVLELWLWRGSALASIATSVLCMQFRTVSLRWEGLSTIARVGSPLLYIVSRIIMTGQVFAALRAMPAETYNTSVLWSYWFNFS